MPNVPEDYVHRIGRTGRAGANGHAISLVSADEVKQLQDIERLIKSKIEREGIEGFEPEHKLPESISTKSAKSKSQKTGNKNNRNKSPWKKTNEQKTHSKSSRPNNANKKNNKPGNRAWRSGSSSAQAV